MVPKTPIPKPRQFPVPRIPIALPRACATPSDGGQNRDSSHPFGPRGNASPSVGDPNADTARGTRAISIGVLPESSGRAADSSIELAAHGLWTPSQSVDLSSQVSETLARVSVVPAKLPSPTDKNSLDQKKLGLFVSRRDDSPLAGNPTKPDYLLQALLGKSRLLSLEAFYTVYLALLYFLQ